ncbi:glycosyltransferase [Kribbella caucasensis]|uniref:glycosyltransferase n=1 Tax=Kribbella caucasensis TaxID=2512215 RepID=UPI00192D6202|nr:glycosyltransferase [Kribbella sp. VKM Ac-2527]
MIVRDEVDFGAAIAAERLGVPCPSVLVLAAGSLLRKELIAEPLAELRAEYGLPSDPGLAMLDRDLVLTPFPPSFRSPGFPLPASAFSYRPADVVPALVRSKTPTVYFTLGTVFQPDADDLFSRVLAGLRTVPAKVIVTVGERNDPAALGPQPDHVRVERFIPQEELLPYCDLVVSHGGSGSLLGALAHGLPSVLLPLGADQPHNAQRCVELGLGQMHDAATVTPDEVAATVSAVLADQNYRHAAERWRCSGPRNPPPDGCSQGCPVARAHYRVRFAVSNATNSGEATVLPPAGIRPIERSQRSDPRPHLRRGRGRTTSRSFANADGDYRDPANVRRDPRRRDHRSVARRSRPVGDARRRPVARPVPRRW